MRVRVALYCLSSTLLLGLDKENYAYWDIRSENGGSLMVENANQIPLNIDGNTRYIYMMLFSCLYHNLNFWYAN